MGVTECSECVEHKQHIDLLNRAYLYNSMAITVTVLVSGFTMGVLSAIIVLTRI